MTGGAARTGGERAAAVFDLGGVLVDWNPRHLYRKLFAGDEEAMERFLAEVCTQEWNLRQDMGRPFAEAIEELSGRHPEHEPLIRAWFERWPETVGGAIEPAVEVVAELKRRGRPLYALSNWSAETFHHARRMFDFLAWFDDIVISGEVGLVKPDPRLFEYFLERTGREAAECLFVDDSRANVEAARALGFRAVHFRSAEQLREELRRTGLL